MIRVQPVEDTWQVLGQDILPGVEPREVLPTWGPAGPESLGFTLYRSAQRVHAELRPFTPIEWYPGDRADGEPLWSGYTMQAPPGGDTGVAPTSVVCQGWHYYRDDLSRQAMYVHDDLSAWREIRSADVPVSEFPPSLQCVSGDGVIVMGCPVEQSWVTNTAVGVTIDLGPTVLARRVAVQVQRGPGGPGNVTLYCRGHNALTQVSNHLTSAGHEDAFASTANAISQAVNGQTIIGDFVTPRRYVSVFLYLSGATYTATAEDVWKILAIRLTTNSNFIDGTTGLSLLTASEGIKQTRLDLYPLLSSDVSRIADTTFRIRHASWLDGDTTGRGRDEALNDYHGYRYGVDAAKRLFLQPQPSVPRLQVDAADYGVEYVPTSTNDGTDVYNVCTVRGRTGSGEELRVDHYTGEYVTDAPPATVGFTNGSFDVNAAGWSAGVTRSAVVFESSPGGGQGSGQTSYAGSMTGGTFLSGLPYVARVFVGWPTTASGYIRLQFGTDTDYVEQMVRPTTTLSTFYVAETKLGWIPLADRAAANVTWRIVGANSSLIYFFDSGIVYAPTATVLDRQRRMRSFTLNVSAATDPQSMDALARAFLLAHRSVPHKANVTISGDAVTDLVSGAAVSADELGRYYGEMIRVLSVPDPDTGALTSRDGIIASVQGYSPASLALDSERRSLEAMMARMGVVQGTS